MNVPQLIKT